MERKFAENFINILNKELDGVFLDVLSDATIYIVTGNDDKVSLDIVKSLVREGMEDEASSFINDFKNGRDTSTCIRGRDGNFQFMIVKVDVDNGKDHYAVPIETLILKTIDALKRAGILERPSAKRLRGVMNRVANTMTKRVESMLVIERLPSYYL